MPIFLGRNIAKSEKANSYPQPEADKIGRDIARHQKSELIIHDRHGKIQDKDSFVKDPCPPKDKKH